MGTPLATYLGCGIHWVTIREVRPGTWWWGSRRRGRLEERDSAPSLMLWFSYKMLSMGTPLVWLGCGIKWVTVCEVNLAWNRMKREEEEEGKWVLQAAAPAAAACTHGGLPAHWSVKQADRKLTYRMASAKSTHAAYWYTKSHLVGRWILGNIHSIGNLARQYTVVLCKYIRSIKSGCVSFTCQIYNYFLF